MEMEGKENTGGEQYKYLGYIVQRNGGQEPQIRDRVKRGAAVMEQVWGVGKRRFGRNWGRRLWIFDRLAWTVVGYGAEIWGWEERERVERLAERYLKWVLGVERKTPGYMVREELLREKICERAGKKTWEFERRLEKGRGSELARKC